MQLNEGELAGATDGDEHVEPAFGGPHLGEIDVKDADRMALEPLLRLLVALDFRKAADAMPLQTAMQGRRDDRVNVGGSSAAAHRGNRRAAGRAAERR